jgi:hypothetical protein
MATPAPPTTSTKQKAASIHALVQANTLAAPPTPSHASLARVLQTAGVLTPSGVYAAGKGQADVERLMGVPEILQEVSMRHAVAIGA